MKRIAALFGIENTAKKLRRKSFAQYQQDMLVRQGREQFKKLIDRGLSVPVAYL